MKLTKQQQARRAAEIAFRQERIRDNLRRGNINADANEVAFIERELRAVEATAMRREYPALMHRKLFKRTDVPRGATSQSYKFVEQIRRAVIIGQGSQDIPRADVAVSEFPTPMRALGSAFGYSQMEIEAAQFAASNSSAGIQLERERGAAARDSIEQQMNDIAFYGNAAAGLPGALTNANVPTVAAVTDGSQIVWNNAGTKKTSLGMVNDVTSLFDQIRNASGGVLTCDTVAFPPELATLLRTTPWSQAGGSDMTCWQYLEKNYSQITFEETFNLSPNNPLAVDAGVDGNIFAYQNDVTVIDELIAFDFDSMPPEQRGFEWIVFCYGVTGGVRIRKPKGTALLTGATA